jgi:protein ImuB
MVACILVSGFELRAALRARPRLALVPAALAPEPGTEQLLGPVTAAAEQLGVKARMRLGEGLATCPGLVLVDRDPTAVEQEWEALLRRLEDVGIAVEPAEPGVVYFETRGVERLYGGVEAALTRALASVGPVWDPRAGAGGRRFVALAAASVARPGQAVIVEGKEEQAFLEPLPLTLLPLERERYAELEGLGVRRLGELARLPGGAVAERLGPEGKRAWSLARGGERRRVRGRSPAAELAEALSFPEAVANELTLRRAFAALLDRLLSRPERAGRPFRKLALSARLVGGGSWRRTTTLREATAERGRLRAALGPKLAEIPAPLVELRLEAVELAEHTGRQLALVAPEGAEADALLREGLRQVRVGVGAGSVCAVVEVAPWSRIPEARALVVPRDV